MTKWILIGIALTQLISCATKIEMLHKTENPFYYNPKKAVIIIGKVGNLHIGHLSVLTSTGKKLLGVSNSALNRFNVLAWHIDIGDSFTLLDAEIPALQNNIKFDKAHSLLIEKPGIYYYGTILTNPASPPSSTQVILIKKPLPNLVVLANKRYPYVFNELKPVNFQ